MTTSVSKTMEAKGRVYRGKDIMCVNELNPDQKTNSVRVPCEFVDNVLAEFDNQNVEVTVTVTVKTI